MVASKYNLQSIRLYKPSAKADFKHLIEEVAPLYQNGKITKLGSKSGIARALQIAERLGSARKDTGEVGLRQFRELKDKKTNIGKGQVSKTYFVKGTVKTIEQWTHKKSGDESKQYKENCNIDAFKIRAKSKEDAEEEFKKRMHQNFDLDQYEKESKVEAVFIVKEAPTADNQEDKDVKMKASTTVE